MDYPRIIIACSDPRKHGYKEKRDYVKELVDRLDYPHYIVSFPGTVHYLLHSDPKTGFYHGGAIIFALKTLIDNRKEGEIVVYPHGDCQALRYCQFSSQEKEMDFQVRDTREACLFMGKSLGPGFSFKIFYAWYEGEDNFSPIEITF